MRWWIVMVVVALAAACGGPQQAPPPPGDDVAETPAVRFVDRAAALGIDRVTPCGNPQKRYIIEILGSGVAVADYDGDDDLDIYLATGQTIDALRSGEGLVANALYRNDGGTFTEVAAEAGVDLRSWTGGAYFVDHDDDGDKDLFVTRWGTNVLFRNDGDGTFTDVSRESGLGATDEWSASAAFGDLDGDGDLDLYVANYVEFDLDDPPFGGQRVVWRGIEVLPGPQGLVAQHDRLYRNDGDGTFTDVSDEAGIRVDPPLYGLGVVMSDLDVDGDLDVYVANDSVKNYLWRNDGALRFSEQGALAGVATTEDARPQAGMGTDAGDFDGDGLMDLVVTNFSHDFNSLYRNRGGLIFTDATFEVGFKDSYDRLVWGVKFFDWDHDGLADLFCANGHVYPEVDDHPQLNTTFRQRNSLYRNAGGGVFENAGPTAGPGLATERSSRGVAVADLDADGDLDIVVTSVDDVPEVLINEGGNRRPWLAVRLRGVASNRDGVGARIELVAADRRELREVNPFGSFQSQSAYDVHFGLGDAERVDRLTVRWPSGQVDELRDLPARRLVTIAEGRGILDETTRSGE